VGTSGRDRLREQDDGDFKAKKTEKVKLLASELESSTTAIIGTFSS